MDEGFTTHTDVETRGKMEMLEESRQRFILADSSKLGILEDTVFATFADSLMLITDKLTNANVVETLAKEARKRALNTQIIIA